MSKNIDVNATSITSFLPSFSCTVHNNITPPLYSTVCTNMKLGITKKRSSRIFNRAPINFWEPEKWKKIPRPKTTFTKTVFVMRSNTILPIKRVTHTKSISNLSLMVLLSNGSNSWRTSIREAENLCSSK